MACLFTSLIRTKQAIAGRLPPMMELTAEAKKVLDPAFVPGLGGLEEDEERGLRCPVRDCGRHYHALNIHLYNSHPRVSPARLRHLLSLGPRTPLASSKLREQLSLAATNAPRRSRPSIRRHSRRARVATMRMTKNSVGFRNLHNTCDEQLAHRLLDLRNKIGRTPSAEDAESVCGRGLVTVVQRRYGGWNAGLLHLAISDPSEIRRPGGVPVWCLAGVMEAFSAYRNRHGRMPMMREARASVVPRLPDARVVYRVLGVHSWPLAMQIIADALKTHKRGAA